MNTPTLAPVSGAMPITPVLPAVLSKLDIGLNTYYLNEEDGWQPDLDDIKRKITPRTRGIVLINPNNPTGAMCSRRMLEQLGHAVVLCVDGQEAVAAAQDQHGAGLVAGQQGAFAEHVQQTRHAAGQRMQAAHGRVVEHEMLRPSDREAMAQVERALGEEMTGHLGYDKHDPAGANSGNSRNGATAKTVQTEVGVYREIRAARCAAARW